MTEREQFSVPATIWLKPSSYRKLAVLAQHRNTSVAVVASKLVDRVVQAPPPPKPGARRMSAEQVAQLVLLHEQGYSDGQIARRLGFTQPSISYRRRMLGLPRNYEPKGAS